MEVMDVDRGQKKGHFSNVKLTSVILTFKNHLLTQVKRGGRTWAFCYCGFRPRGVQFFFRFYLRIIMIFTKSFKTFDLGKSIVLSGQHESRSRTGLVVKNWFFAW